MELNNWNRKDREGKKNLFKYEQDVKARNSSYIVAHQTQLSNPG